MIPTVSPSQFKASVKVGSKLRYKGPPYDPERYQNPQDHPDYYKHFRVEKIHPRQYGWHSGVFVLKSCVERESGTPCDGWGYVMPDEWEIIEEWV